MTFLWAIILVLVNAVWLCLTLLGLPGNWLMVAGTVLLAWWRWDTHRPAGDQMFSIGTLAAIVLLAGAGEILEFLAAALGAKRAGASRRGAWGALGGGFVGGIVGTFLIPIPLLGTLVGACLGAGFCAWGLELAGGRTHRASVHAAVGAGAGRLLGTMIKLAIGILIWIVIAVAAFWP